MKKGRLAFVNGSFVAVESAAATAKRLRAAAATSAPTKPISKPPRARASLSATATAAAAAAAAAAAEDLGGIAVRTPTGSTRPLSRHRSETGLYSLLDAIEFVEYQKPA